MLANMGLCLINIHDNSDKRSLVRNFKYTSYGNTLAKEMSVGFLLNLTIMQRIIICFNALMKAEKKDREIIKIFTLISSTINSHKTQEETEKEVKELDDKIEKEKANEKNLKITEDDHSHNSFVQFALNLYRSIKGKDKKHYTSNQKTELAQYQKAYKEEEKKLKDNRKNATQKFQELFTIYNEYPESFDVSKISLNIDNVAYNLNKLGFKKNKNKIEEQKKKDIIQLTDVSVPTEQLHNNFIYISKQMKYVVSKYIIEINSAMEKEGAKIDEFLSTTKNYPSIILRLENMLCMLLRLRDSNYNMNGYKREEGKDNWILIPQDLTVKNSTSTLEEKDKKKQDKADKKKRLLLLKKT